MSRPYPNRCRKQPDRPGGPPGRRGAAGKLTGEHHRGARRWPGTTGYSIAWATIPARPGLGWVQRGVEPRPVGIVRVYVVVTGVGRCQNRVGGRFRCLAGTRSCFRYPRRSTARSTPMCCSSRP